MLYYNMSRHVTQLKLESYKGCHTTVRQNFFSQRIVNEWNKLPQVVIEATSVNGFKNKLDRHWKDMGAYTAEQLNSSSSQQPGESRKILTDKKGPLYRLWSEIGDVLLASCC